MLSSISSCPSSSFSSLHMVQQQQPQQQQPQHQHISLQNVELAIFRTQVCEQHRNGGCRNADRCFWSHCETWQRRNPNEFRYSSKLCPEIEFVKKGVKMTLKRRCTRGRACSFSHSKEEELYHPELYKTKMCNSYPNCNRYYCPFAHNSEELKKPVIPTVGDSRSIPNSTKSMSRSRVQCPASPMSASTTASSTSPILACSSPTSANPSLCQRGSLFERDSRTGAASVTASNSRPPLTNEEAILYGDILMTMLQREGLSDEEKAALRTYKLQSDSFSSTSTYETMASSESLIPPSDDEGRDGYNRPPGLVSIFGNARAKAFSTDCPLDKRVSEAAPNLASSLMNHSTQTGLQNLQNHFFPELFRQSNEKRNHFERAHQLAVNSKAGCSSDHQDSSSLLALSALLNSTSSVCPPLHSTLGNSNSLSLLVELLKQICESPTNLSPTSHI